LDFAKGVGRDDEVPAFVATVGKIVEHIGHRELGPKMVAIGVAAGLSTASSAESRREQQRRHLRAMQGKRSLIAECVEDPDSCRPGWRKLANTGGHR